METLFKLDSVRALTRQEYFNPKIVVVYLSEANYIAAQYKCSPMWLDPRLRVAGFKFANKTHLQQLMQHRKELLELKQQLWNYRSNPPPVSRLQELLNELKSRTVQDEDEDDD
jgi:hypothetical protein